MYFETHKFNGLTIASPIEIYVKKNTLGAFKFLFSRIFKPLNLIIVVNA